MSSFDREEGGNAFHDGIGELPSVFLAVEHCSHSSCSHSLSSTRFLVLFSLFLNSIYFCLSLHRHHKFKNAHPGDLYLHPTGEHLYF